MSTIQQTVSQGTAPPGRQTMAARFWRLIVKDWLRNKYLYLMMLPVLIYYLVFHYGPMYGAVIAFQNFNPVKGIAGSPWVGLDNFREFFEGFYFGRLIRNTLVINLLDLAIGFPAPIILALLLNELHWNPFRRLVQTITYMPHFISVIVIVGMMVDFMARDGLFNNILMATFNLEPVAFLQEPKLFPITYVLSGVWQHVGWSSIIYLAAITTIDSTLYEAAMVDGAGRFQRIRHITLPGIMPTIVILLILRMGTMMTIGFEKILLMYNPLTYETADVISTYIYRKGILESNYSFSAAVGLFNSVINFTLLVLANGFSRRVTRSSLW